MNSSISASEPGGSGVWRRWLWQFIATTAAAALGVLAFVVVLDPFSTGRLTPIGRIDYATGNRLYSGVARVRDPRFDAAVFGNSHAVRIAPPELDLATGRRFVMLGIEGTWPAEHLLLLREFERRHPSSVLVVVLDDNWCVPAPQSASIAPRWLYTGSQRAYLGHILSPFSLRVAWRRLLVLSGFASGERADGYDPAPWQPFARDKMMEQMLTMSSPTEAPEATAPFPFLDDLGQTLAGLQPDTAVLMVFTPVFGKYLPQPGSAADARLRACKTQAEALARARPRTAMLDLRVPGPKIDDPANFTDLSHFKDGIARDVEAAIARRLTEMLGKAAR